MGVPLRTAALLATSTVALPTVGIGVAQHASSATAGTTVRVTETLTSDVPADVGEKGLGQGDVATFTSRLADGSGKKIGSAIGTCTVIAASGDEIADALCTSVYRLKGGTVIVSGPFDATSKKLQQNAIVGGTGKYDGARGSLQFRVISAKSFSDTFRVRF